MDKGERLKIGLLYNYNEKWIGGTYYVSNLIHALNSIEDSRKPQIYIVATLQREYDQLVELTKYPYISFMHLFPQNVVQRGINKLYGIIRPDKKLIPIKHTFPNLLFPVPLTRVYIDIVQEKVRYAIYWIPDLQEKSLPHFFSNKEIEERTALQKEIAYQKQYVVFSSFDAQRSFNQYFPNSSIKQFVVPFAVTHPQYNQLSGEALLQKYGLLNKYFFSPNQFWIHKNHIVILKALKLAKERGIDLYVAFSGKEYDHRNPKYFEELKEFVKSSGLESNVSFLGFIDRAEQLKLMSMSIAIIQPSKSEGWSTVIEDAKAMNKYVLASSIPVHKEQIKSNVRFFEPDDTEMLTEELMSALRDQPKTSKYDYQQDVKRFADNFLNMINIL